MVLEKIRILGDLLECLQRRFAVLSIELNQEGVVPFTIYAKLNETRVDFIFVPARQLCHRRVDAFIHLWFDVLSIITDDMFVIMRLHRRPVLLMLLIINLSCIGNTLLDMLTSLQSNLLRFAIELVCHLYAMIVHIDGYTVYIVLDVSHVTVTTVRVNGPPMVQFLS